MSNLDSGVNWQQVAEEFRQSWFLTLAVLLLKNDMKVTLTLEELEQAKLVEITKSQDDVNGSITFTGVLKDAGSKS